MAIFHSYVSLPEGIHVISITMGQISIFTGKTHIISTERWHGKSPIPCSFQQLSCHLQLGLIDVEPGHVGTWHCAKLTLGWKEELLESVAILVIPRSWGYMHVWGLMGNTTLAFFAYCS